MHINRKRLGQEASPAMNILDAQNFDTRENTNESNNDKYGAAIIRKKLNQASNSMGYSPNREV